MFHPYLMSMGKPTVQPAKSMIRLRRPEPLEDLPEVPSEFLALGLVEPLPEVLRRDGPQS